MPQIKGIDVSKWQGVIDWKKVAGDGVKFVFVKATEGTGYVSPTFYDQVKGAKAAGIAVGTYHYAKFGSVAEAQAEASFFLSKIKGIQFEYPVVLDLEENKKGASRTVLTDAAIAFLEAIEKAGYCAMLYTGKSFIQDQLDESRLKPYALWIARYGPTLGCSADIWQYSQSGKVNGIAGNVDMNWAYRDFSSPVVKVEVPPVKVEAKTIDSKTAEAIKILQSAGVISSPSYWLNNAVPGKAVKGENVAALIQKFAIIVKGVVK